ncbi:N-acetylmannosamine kinase [Spirochaetia bacterium]|nr:N-acetylmannosamine kinase [Spirochaetia bacterium]
MEYINDDDYMSRINSRYDVLTNKQKKIAAYLTAHPKDVINNSITNLAKKIGTTPPSLTRFCQLIRYKGFSDLKFCLERSIPGRFETNLDIISSDPIVTIKKKLLHIGMKAIEESLLLIDQHHVERAVYQICKANKIHVYADGGPAASANYAYQIFLQMGLPCSSFTDIKLAQMAVTQLNYGDVAIGITFSGDSTSIVEVMNIAKKRRAHTIGITAHTNSAIAKMVDLPLCYSSSIKDNLRYLHLARICEIAIIGLLQSAIMNYIPEKIRNNVISSREAIEKSRKK